MIHSSEDVIAEKYRIFSPLGEGAFATTYEAEDIVSCQRVAIKVLSLRQTQDWKILELFEREAKVLRQISHPSIPKYIDYFQLETNSDRRFYLVQELISGQSLSELMKTGWHPGEEEVKKIAIEILKILQYLHQMTPPILHRDIKPQNIIRRADGQVFLVDFGAVQDVYRNTLTRGGTFVGTLGYMPREQFRGDVKPASDLYALGATLLFLLTSRSPIELPQRRMKIDFRSSVSISDDFAYWLEKMLSPAIEDRFQSAREADHNLFSVFEQTSQLSPSSQKGSQILDYPTRRHRSPNIVCRETGDRQKLTININRQGLPDRLEGKILLAMFMGIFFFIKLLTVSALLTASIFSFIFAIIWCVIHITKPLKFLKSDIFINIDSSNFTVEHIYQEKIIRQKKFEASKINWLDSQTYYQKSKSNVSHHVLEVWVGVHKHNISLPKHLTEEEVNWLVRQISSYLGIQRG